MEYDGDIKSSLVFGVSQQVLDYMLQRLHLLLCSVSENVRDYRADV